MLQSKLELVCKRLEYITNYEWNVWHETNTIDWSYLLTKMGTCRVIRIRTLEGCTWLDIDGVHFSRHVLKSEATKISVPVRFHYKQIANAIVFHILDRKYRHAGVVTILARPTD